MTAFIAFVVFIGSAIADMVDVFKWTGSRDSQSGDCAGSTKTASAKLEPNGLS
eukprot:CAMPEP_0175506464 /NCGR_PEP_ID=MMETSP0096-20121207/9364_1 /TAXON_ID=311494 /ORGANISM="Alexandrium monilatum, Strain CCMP3105" /LENGTH=52 /DNA_ID=CAMNT_0016808565 /DNA_START=457 /DNA_END=612 /DNA_ORIENTATION=-